MSQTKNLSLLLLAAGMATAGGFALEESAHEASKVEAIGSAQSSNAKASQVPTRPTSWVRWPWLAATAR